MNKDSHTSFVQVAPTLGVAVLTALITLTGCSAAEPGADGAAGSSATAGGPGAGGAMVASGGVNPAGGAPGGAGMAGAEPTAGSALTAGAGGGSSMSGSGAGGMSGGGSSGTGGAAGGSSGGSTGGSLPASPSTGCSKASPMTGSSGSPLTVSGHQYYVKLPARYDASKPYRVLFVFNPTGNPITWAEQNAGFESNGAKDTAIRVYPAPASMASGWGAGDVAFFRPLYDKVMGDYCADKARVFAAGESSGGDFSSIIGCEDGDVLRGVAPCATKDVGSYPLDTTKRQCKGEVTSIVIHGLNDMVVGPANGPKTRDFYAKLNHCSSMTTPVQGYTDTLSNCVQYQGCDAGFPVYWCGHTDPNYSNTNHGWPKFAANMTWSVFSAY